MYKISDKLIEFTTETIKNRKLELITGGKSEGVKIQRNIFQGDVISPLLFVIAMMSLTHVLRKCTGSYKFIKSQKKD